MLGAWLGSLLSLGCGPTPAHAPPQPGAQPAGVPGDEVGEPAPTVPIVMYMTTWCPVCTKASSWLRRGGYSFVEYDVETDVRANRVMRLFNPRGTVPMFEVGGRVLIGFSPQHLRQAIRRAAAEMRARAAERKSRPEASPQL